MWQIVMVNKYLLDERNYIFLLKNLKSSFISFKQSIFKNNLVFRWSTVFQYLTYDPDFFFWPQDMTLGCVYPFTGLVPAYLVNLHLKFTSAKTPCSASLFSPTYSFLILSQISMRTLLSIILMFLFLFCLVTTCYHTAFATWLHVTSYVLIVKVLAKYP